MIGLRCGSLFSGVGLFELGLIWSGLVTEVAWQVEIDPWCNDVLGKWFPRANRSVRDVRLAGSSNLAPVDLICGGFPCQDVSGAGLGAGLDGARSGLWYEYLRILGELRPRIAIVENVASGKGRWLCAVRSGLHALGYRTRALQISAADVGLPHRRERVFVVAYADGAKLRLEPGRSGGANGPGAAESGRGGEALADPSSERLEDRHGLAGDLGAQFQTAERGGEATLADAASARWARGLGEGGDDARRPGSALYTARPAFPRLGRGPYGLPDRVDRAPAGRGADQHKWEPPRTALRVPQRQARLRALGNGIAPQCVEAVGRFVVAEILPLVVRP